MSSELFETNPGIEEKPFNVAYVDDIFGDKDEITAEMVRGAARGANKPRMMLIADNNFVQNNPQIGSTIGRYLKRNNIQLLGLPVTTKRSNVKEQRSDPLQLALSLAKSMFDVHLTAYDALMILGGGAIMDIASFAASSIYRGVRNIVRVPTTLVSMVECSCSTEVSIDTPNIRKAYTTTSIPYATIVSAGLNKTAFDGVWKGGGATMMRFAAVRDAEFMRKLMKEGHYIKERNEEKTAKLLHKFLALRTKMSDTSFAQWCADKLWTLSGGKIPHGYGCAISICIECAYAVSQGVLSAKDQEAICRAVADVGALDGLVYSNHVLSQTDAILAGIDEWIMLRGSTARSVPAGIGVEKTIVSMDKLIYEKIIKDFILAYTGS
ncbi:MAG: iron-containing alcohol dehydrogenase [Kiritimatiellae bacterium]|nr:iron-containing alcohol dehydrogenase [Kiritimatiellia bacterium]